MAYKDKLKEQQYQKEYYEKHKKLKGRRRKVKGVSDRTFSKKQKSVAKIEKKRAIRRMLKGFKEKWSRMS